MARYQVVPNINPSVACCSGCDVFSVMIECMCFGSCPLTWNQIRWNNTFPPFNHRENGGTLGIRMVALRINPGLLGGVIIRASRRRYETAFNTEMQRIDGNCQCPLQAGTAVNKTFTKRTLSQLKYLLCVSLYHLDGAASVIHPILHVTGDFCICFP